MDAHGQTLYGVPVKDNRRVSIESTNTLYNLTTTAKKKDASSLAELSPKKQLATTQELSPKETTINVKESYLPS